jgi:hypothetical protein
MHSEPFLPTRIACAATKTDLKATLLLLPSTQAGHLPLSPGWLHHQPDSNLHLSSPSPHGSRWIWIKPILLPKASEWHCVCLFTPSLPLGGVPTSNCAHCPPAQAVSQALSQHLSVWHSLTWNCFCNFLDTFVNF